MTESIQPSFRLGDIVKLTPEAINNALNRLKDDLLIADKDDINPEIIETNIVLVDDPDRQYRIIGIDTDVFWEPDNSLKVPLYTLEVSDQVFFLVEDVFNEEELIKV